MPKDIQKLNKVIEKISQALDKAFDRAMKQQEAICIDIHRAKLVIFSDHHRGSRDGADDFKVCEQAYNAALVYYDRLGYTLLVMGDVEELWEDWPEATVKAYAHTLELEGNFHRDGRYIRFWGNHDDAWRHPDLVEQWLVPALHVKKDEPPLPLKVHEALILYAGKSGKEVGTLFLVHGHQGTFDSERIAPISKFLLRYFWRPLQRIVKFSFNTPAMDFGLRYEHESAMYSWSVKKNVVLIAGHTHRPVFKSESHEDVARKALEAAEGSLRKPPDTWSRRHVAELAADVEWIRTKNQQSQPPFVDFKKPSYFNTGCCAFLDGDITGLEISDGEIRLVRWPDDEGRAKPKVLASAKLEDIFDECRKDTS